jgi:nucleotide-binding universal stress UspA family protein
MKILLAIDDSRFSQAAAQGLVARVRPENTEVHVLHVIEPVPVYVSGEMGVSIPDLGAAQEARVKDGKELVERAAQSLRAAGFKVSTAVLEGNPKTEILDRAARWHADLIVLGSHGRRGLDRFLLGSVSEAVARHASCSVEIVRLAASPR